MPRAVVAIGGNALARGGDASAGTAREILAEVNTHIAALAARGWSIAITHGNGPQVGYGLLRHEAGAGLAPRDPLDVLGAETQGSLGYLIQQSLGGALAAHGEARAVVTVVTQVVVDPSDPAFAAPTKPIGPFYTPAQAEERARAHGWSMVEDAGRGWRRVVPSPDPLDVVEGPVISGLLDAGVVVIAAGGGGIPVVRSEAGLTGIEAVIDKDLASAVLGRVVRADALAVVTSVERVALGFGTPAEHWLDRLSVADAKRYLAAGEFPAGSMGPKITAAVRFIESGGEFVVITTAPRLGEALAGRDGTRVTR
jgi:carbamate kinase